MKPSDGLRAVLEEARDEYEAVWRSHRDVEPDMVAIHEPHVRRWLRERLAASRSPLPWEERVTLFQIHPEASSPREIARLAEERHAAVDEVARLREIARKAAGECPDCKGYGYVVVCLRTGGSDIEGENVDPGDWDRADCERCAALREIAGEGKP
jgi:hypothetical protein